MYTKYRTYLGLAATAGILALGGCSSSHDNKGPRVGTMMRQFDLVDKADGKLYGTAEMDPIGGGRIIDSSGRVIGNIMPPPPSGVYVPPPPPPHPATYMPLPR